MCACNIPDDEASNHVSTLSMVFTLVSMVFGVFLCFASVAVYCYRYAPAKRIDLAVADLGWGWLLTTLATLDLCPDWSRSRGNNHVRLLRSCKSREVQLYYAQNQHFMGAPTMAVSRPAYLGLFHTHVSHGSAISEKKVEMDGIGHPQL